MHEEASKTYTHKNPLANIPGIFITKHRLLSAVYPDYIQVYNHARPILYR